MARKLSQGGNLSQSFDAALFRNFLFLFSWLAPVSMVVFGEVHWDKKMRAMDGHIQLWLAGLRDTPSEVPHYVWWMYDFCCLVV